MATGDLFFFGSNGAYSQSDTAGLANQQVAQQNAYNSLYGNSTSTTTAITYGGLGSALGQISGIQYYPVPQGLVDVEKKVVKVAKGILAKLRAEVDGWHGDILERCPA
jgi:hypothetical protein